MDYRMSLRISTDVPVVVKPMIGQAFAGELRDVSFDGAFLATTRKHSERLLHKHVCVYMNGTATYGVMPLKLSALVVRVEIGGLALEFDSYGQVANDFLEGIYATQLRRDSVPLSSSV